ncbi:hypothetical protein [Halorubrum miltondacostae]|uniref:Halobacterial output domain-containing protein n=1 Tax=Halorubrum miltondacostae TaxID=3076378 RepID=A0ABD5M9R8_9EURY
MDSSVGPPRDEYAVSSDYQIVRVCPHFGLLQNLADSGGGGVGVFVSVTSRFEYNDPVAVLVDCVSAMTVGRESDALNTRLRTDVNRTDSVMRRGINDIDDTVTAAAAVEASLIRIDSELMRLRTYTDSGDEFRFDRVDHRNRIAS